MVFKWRDNYTDEFLNIYRSYEYLWNNLNPLYKNRVARESAYKEILQTLNLPNLTVRDVKNKIKTIRTNYKYELNKVLRSQEDAVNPSEVYVPHLFWFKKADEFLREFSMARGSFNSSKMEHVSEDETSYTQSEDNTHLQSEPEGLDIKIKEESLHEEEEPSIEGINFDNRSRSPSPPDAKFRKVDDGKPISKQPLTISEHLKSFVSLNSLPPFSNHAENKFHTLPAFKTPGSGGRKINGRQLRKSSITNPAPKPRISPIRQSTRQSLELEERINSLQRSVDSLKRENDDEFDLFGKSIALQLKNMPLERAFICQENLQRIINEERLNQSNLSMNGNGSTS